MYVAAHKYHTVIISLLLAVLSLPCQANINGLATNFPVPFSGVSTCVSSLAMRTICICGLGLALLISANLTNAPCFPLLLKKRLSVRGPVQHHLPEHSVQYRCPFYNLLSPNAYRQKTIVSLTLSTALATNMHLELIILFISFRIVIAGK